MAESGLCLLISYQIILVVKDLLLKLPATLKSRYVRIGLHIVVVA